jgi:hypothetical protein
VILSVEAFATIGSIPCGTSQHKYGYSTAHR